MLVDEFSATEPPALWVLLARVASCGSLLNHSCTFVSADRHRELVVGLGSSCDRVSRRISPSGSSLALTVMVKPKPTPVASGPSSSRDRSAVCAYRRHLEEGQTYRTPAREMKGRYAGVRMSSYGYFLGFEFGRERTGWPMRPCGHAQLRSMLSPVSRLTRYPPGSFLVVVLVP